MPAVHSRPGIAERERGVQMGEEHELEIDLRTRIHDTLLVRLAVRVGNQQRREQGQAGPGAVKTRKTQLPEAKRGKIPFKHGSPERGAACGVDLNAREAVKFTVTLHVLIVHPVVAEPAEVEVRKRIVPRPGRISGGAPEPDRGVVEKKLAADIQPGPEVRECSLYGQPRGIVERTDDALFVLYRAQRPRQV